MGKKLTDTEIRTCYTRMRLTHHTRMRTPAETKYVGWMMTMHEDGAWKGTEWGDETRV